MNTLEVPGATARLMLNKFRREGFGDTIKTALLALTFADENRNSDHFADALEAARMALADDQAQADKDAARRSALFDLYAKINAARPTKASVLTHGYRAPQEAEEEMPHSCASCEA